MSCKIPYVYMNSLEDKACTIEVPGKNLSHCSDYRIWFQELAVSGLKLESLNTISIAFVQLCNSIKKKKSSTSHDYNPFLRNI